MARLPGWRAGMAGVLVLAAAAAAAEEGGEGKEIRITMDLPGACMKAFTAAGAGKVDEFISCFDSPSDAQKETLKAYAAILQAGSALNAAYVAKFKEEFPRELAAWFVFEDPASFKNAKTLIDGKFTGADGRTVGVVSRVGYPVIPLVLAKTEWKIHQDYVKELDAKQMKTLAERAEAAKEFTAAIQEGAYGSARAAREAMAEKRMESLQER